MKLYGYWRSSATWRVRIGLALKGVQVEHVPVDLRVGDHLNDAHQCRNSMRQVPVLEWIEQGATRRISQSLAILMYLERLCSEPALIPFDAEDAARVWEFSEIVNSGIHPLQNLSTQKRVESISGMSGKNWARMWIEDGLGALEHKAAQSSDDFLVGDQPTIADCCLVPQLYNARRFGCDISAWPRLMDVELACLELPSFFYTHPDRHIDTVNVLNTAGEQHVQRESRYYWA